MKNINILYLIGIAVLLVFVAPTFFTWYPHGDVIAQNNPSAIDGYACFSKASMVDDIDDKAKPGMNIYVLEYERNKVPYAKYYYATYNYECKQSLTGYHIESAGRVVMRIDNGDAYMNLNERCSYNNAHYQDLKACYADSIANAKLYYDQTFNKPVVVKEQQPVEQPVIIPVIPDSNTTIIKPVVNPIIKFINNIINWIVRLFK